ncbi:methyltransferase [Micromonospora rubida]
MNQPISDPRQLADTMRAFSLSRLLTTAVTSGVVNAVAEAEPATGAELATSLKLATPHLDRLVSALVAVGVLERHDGGAVSLTPVGRFLADGEGGSLAPMARMLHEEGWSAWADFPRWLEQSESGDDVFDAFDAEPETYEVFERQMLTGTARHAAGVAAAAGLTGDESVLDVGGGSGGMARAFLAAYEGVHVTVGDRPYARAGALAYLSDVTPDRWRFVDLDFFEAVPPGHDVYLLSRILHDWSDDKARRIVRACADAMSDAGRLLIFERSVAGAMTASLAMADLNTGLMCGGRERSLADFSDLLTAEGLRVTRTVAVSGDHWLIEARADASGR